MISALGGTVWRRTCARDRKARQRDRLQAQIRAALHQVAARLGNTVAICRKCYVHPSVLEAFTTGTLRLRRLAANDNALRPEEAATLRFLRRRA